MGQFSWLDCKTGVQVLDDVRRNVYLLIPKKFGGGHIKEECYDGYGRFGGIDVYNLVALWNREMIPEIIRRAEDGNWTSRVNKEQMLKFYETQETDDYPLRYLGIEMACYDKDNFALEYPIKITYDENAVYEDCNPSKADPNQGWLYEDDGEDW